MTQLIPYQSKLFIKHSLAHGFFTRHGGVSTGVFTSLNVGYKTTEDSSNVLHNRSLLAQYFQQDIAQLKFLQQCHGNKVITINNPDDIPGAGDAMVTKQKNIILGLQTADCVPILLYDSANAIIACAHAGWQGLLSGIVPNVLDVIKNLGGIDGAIDAVIGPAIYQISYEVDNKVYRKFIMQNNVYKIFFITSGKRDHYLFDIIGLAKYQLLVHGVQNIDIIGHDTYANDDFFSCRRSYHNGVKIFGNQASCIML